MRMTHKDIKEDRKERKALSKHSSLPFSPTKLSILGSKNEWNTLLGLLVAS